MTHAYDYLAPAPGEQLLVAGIRFDVTRFTLGAYPDRSKLHGTFALDPATATQLDPAEYAGPYQFAYEHYAHLPGGLASWLASYHSATPGLTLGTRTTSKRERYTLHSHAGLHHVMVRQADATALRPMTIARWLYTLKKR